MHDSFLATSKIGNITISENGLTACSFENPNGGISVAFKGTAGGEWIDNGEGLSGVAEENTYIFYDKAKVPHHRTVKNDYASDQQAEALNWFSRISAENDWGHNTKITISGHSKGGNKAQFITVNSDLVDKCFSFNGQGFSPEALAYMKKQLGTEYDTRRQRIFSFVTSNDYVNVLGSRLVPQNHIYYFKSNAGIHHIDSMLNQNGNLLPQSRQGALSAYAEKVSKDLMAMPPSVRQYATLGIMNIFQNYSGKGLALNGDFVSTEKTIAGIIIAIGSFLNNLGETN